MASVESLLHVRTGRAALARQDDRGRPLGARCLVAPITVDVVRTFAGKRVLLLGGSTTRRLVFAFVLASLNETAQTQFPKSGEFFQDVGININETMEQSFAHHGWSFQHFPCEVDRGYGCSDCRCACIDGTFSPRRDWLDFEARHRYTNTAIHFSWKPELYSQADANAFAARWSESGRSLPYDLIQVGKGLHDAMFRQRGVATHGRYVVAQARKFGQLLGSLPACSLVVIRTPYVVTNGTERKAVACTRHALARLAEDGGFGKRSVLLDVFALTAAPGAPRTYDGHHYQHPTHATVWQMLALALEAASMKCPARLEATTAAAPTNPTFAALADRVVWARANKTASYAWPDGRLRHFSPAAAMNLLRGRHVLVLGNSVARHVVIALHLLIQGRAPDVHVIKIGGHALPEAESSIWATHGAASAELTPNQKYVSDACRHPEKNMDASAATVNCCVARRKASDASMLLTYAFTSRPSEPQIRKTLDRWAGRANCADSLAPDYVVLCLTQTDVVAFRALAKQCAALRKLHPRIIFVLVTPTHAKHAVWSALRDFDRAAVESVKAFDGVVALPLGDATARGIATGALRHDSHNSFHYADAGQLFELEMLLNAFSIAASQRAPNSAAAPTSATGALADRVVAVRRVRRRRRPVSRSPRPGLESVGGVPNLSTDTLLDFCDNVRQAGNVLYRVQGEVRGNSIDVLAVREDSRRCLAPSNEWLSLLRDSYYTPWCPGCQRTAHYKPVASMYARLALMNRTEASFINASVVP